MQAALVPAPAFPYAHRVTRQACWCLLLTGQSVHVRCPGLMPLLLSLVSGWYGGLWAEWEMFPAVAVACEVPCAGGPSALGGGGTPGCNRSHAPSRCASQCAAPANALMATMARAIGCMVPSGQGHDKKLPFLCSGVSFGNRKCCAMGSSG